MSENPTRNLIMGAANATVFDLGRTYKVGMAQSPNHPAYWHTLPRRHGDMVRPDGGSAANDYITMGTHVGTHIDALSHVSHDGELFGGVDASTAQVGGRFEDLGIHTVEPIVRRGVLYDVAALQGSPCPPAYEVTPADLESCEQATGVTVGEGDVALIRTGWGLNWDDGDAYIGRSTGVPGPGSAAAEWLADRSPFAVGADTIAFECIAPGAGHSILPVHRVLLVESGIHIMETLALDDLAAAEVWEFLFVAIPLSLYGATGSPIRPLALVGE